MTVLSKLEEKTLQELAKLNRANLENLKMYQLQAYADHLSVRGRSKMKHKELVAKLLEMSQGYRDALKAKANLNILDVTHELTFDADFLIEQFESGKEPEKLAEIIVNYWQNSPGKNGNLTNSTLVKMKPKQLKSSLEILYSRQPKALEWGESLYQAVRNILAPINQQINNEYNAAVETVGNPESQLRLEGKRIVAWAEDILMNYINSDDPSKGWARVSLALALTSGRRMDEIHGDVCRFELANDNCIKSLGLSKKPDDNSCLISPCLISNDLWLKAWNYLPAARKGLTNAKVNGVISSNFSQILKPAVYPTLGIKAYKDSRDFYAAYALKYLWDANKHGSQITFIREILGHESKKTSLSYEKILIVEKPA